MIKPEEIEATFAPTKRDDVAWVELDGEAVLYDEDTGRIHLLNPIGSILWACFDGKATLEELIEDLADVYGAPREQVTGDVLTMTRSLGTEGLLDGVEPPPEEDEHDHEGHDHD